MNQIRMSKVEVTKLVSEACAAQANVEVAELKRGPGIHRDGDPGDELLSCPNESDKSNVGKHGYAFGTKTVLLNAYLMGFKYQGT